MPKVVDYDQKKNEIAHKALYAFAFEGFHKTSLGAIAQMCHIGRTTIYEYFRDKDEIFTYSLNQSFDLLELDFRQVLDSPGLDSLGRLAGIVRAVLGVFYRDKRVMLVLLEHSLRILRENQEVAGRFRDRMQGLQELLERILREGIQRKEIRPVDPRRVGLTLAMLVQAAVLQFSVNASTKLEEVLSGIDQMLVGLKP